MAKPAKTPRTTAVDAVDVTVKALGEIYHRVIAATTKGKTPDQVADAQRFTLDGMLSGAGVFYQAQRAGGGSAPGGIRPKTAAADDVSGMTTEALDEIYHRFVAAATKGKTPDQVADAQRFTLDGILSGAGVFYHKQMARVDRPPKRAKAKKKS